MNALLEVLGVAASVLLPWVAGAFVVRALWRGRDDAPTLPLVLGYGYLVGVFLATWVMRAYSLSGVRWSLPLLAGSLVVVTVAAAWLGRRVRSTRATAAPNGLDAASPAARALFWFALALVAVRVSGLAVEVAISPFRSYDTWAQWGSKAIVWYDQGRMSPFVIGPTWLASGSAGVYTDSNPAYPGGIPLILAWTATFLPAWNESLVNTPWVVIPVALALAFYAQARAFGASAAAAMVAAWMLVSLPILDIHVALSGCADLFMGAIYGMAAMALWRWSRTREPPMAWLAAFAALAGLGIKQEGWLWLATLLPGVVVALNRRAGLAFAGAAVVVALAYLALGPESVNIVGYQLRTRPTNVLGTLLAHVFVLDNWHLAGYAIVAIVAWRWRILLAPRLAPMSLTMLAAVGVIVAVYFFSTAALGVANETLVNRMLLHLAPPLMFYGFVLLLEGRSGDQPSLQATKAAEA